MRGRCHDEREVRYNLKLKNMCIYKFSSSILGFNFEFILSDGTNSEGRDFNYVLTLTQKKWVILVASFLDSGSF
jgi:hypothetical protein